MVKNYQFQGKFYQFCGKFRKRTHIGKLNREKTPKFTNFKENLPISRKIVRKEHMPTISTLKKHPNLPISRKNLPISRKMHKKEHVQPH